jgi:uncharacterized protein YfaP (DUF2135 family)
MNKKILFYLTTFLLLVIYISKVESAPFVATVTKVEGKVEVQKAKTEKWIKAEVGMKLSEGDKIKTGAKSEAIIQWGDETIVKLSPYTNFAINKSSINPETKSENTNLQLWIGRVVSKVKKVLTPGSSFEIQTPAAIAGVRSTIWATDVKGDGETTVSTYEGEVMVSAEGTLVIVGKGQMTKVKPKKPPSPPEEQSEEEKKFWEEEKDVAVPKLTVDKPIDGQEFEEDKITVSGTTDPDVTLLINGVGANPDAFGKFEMDVTLNEGDNTITITATNPAGKTIKVTRKIKCKKAKDTTPPEILITEPIDGAILNQQNIVVSGTTEKDAEVTVNGILTPVNVDGSFKQNITLVEGKNTITVVAKDEAGNISTKSLNITLDTTPPLLSITSPSEKFVTNQNLIQISGVTEQGASVSIAGVEVSVNSDGTFSKSIPLKEGVNVIKIEARDKSGNAAFTSIEGILDTIPPILNITSPSENFVSNSPNVLLTGITEKGTKITVDGAEITVNTDGSFSKQLILKEGINSVKVEAKDIAGNITTSIRKIKFEVTPLFLQAVIREKGTLRELSDYSKTSISSAIVFGFTKPGAKAYVNYKEVYVYPDGHFEYEIKFKEGGNPVNISAQDLSGNKLEINRKIYYVNIPPLPPQQ